MASTTLVQARFGRPVLGGQGAENIGRALPTEEVLGGGVVAGNTLPAEDGLPASERGRIVAVDDEGDEDEDEIPVEEQPFEADEEFDEEDFDDDFDDDFEEEVQDFDEETGEEDEDLPEAEEEDGEHEFEEEVE